MTQELVGRELQSEGRRVSLACKRCAVLLITFTL